MVYRRGRHLDFSSQVVASDWNTLVSCMTSPLPPSAFQSLKEENIFPSTSWTFARSMRHYIYR